jgi:hypothetical protein
MTVMAHYDHNSMERWSQVSACPTQLLAGRQVAAGRNGRRLGGGRVEVGSADMRLSWSTAPRAVALTGRGPTRKPTGNDWHSDARSSDALCTERSHYRPIDCTAASGRVRALTTSGSSAVHAVCISQRPATNGHSTWSPRSPTIPFIAFTDTDRLPR